MSQQNQQENKQQTQKPINDIRIGMNSRVRNVVRYCNGLLREKSTSSLHFSAVGGAIGKLVSTVEVLKVVNPNLYQQNKLATVSYQSVDDNKTVTNQRLYPKMEVILSLEKPNEVNEGFQDKLPESEREELYKIFNNENSRNMRFRGRGRFGFRGRFNRGFGRGFRFRGFYRGFRGNLRGRGMRSRGNLRGRGNLRRGNLRGRGNLRRGNFRGRRGRGRN